MQDKDALDPRPADGRDWTNVWEAVSRLAAARHSAAHDPGPDRLRISTAEATVDRPPTGSEAVRPIAPVDPGQLARAVAEIEKASAALRRSEPALEIWRPGSAPRRETRKYLSVWLLIGGIWISATLVVAGATGAILYLLG
jgi:hypothetical protein